MARKTATVDDGDDQTDAPMKGRHQLELLAKGCMRLFASRPRGRAYMLEEWMSPNRRFFIVKAFDTGEYVRFDEYFPAPAQAASGK